MLRRMPRYEAFDWYRTPVYYDIIFDEDTDVEADFLAGVYDRYVKSKGKQVLEPACGSGRLLAAMHERGFAVSGFDLCPEMLDFSRERLKAADANGVLKEGAFDDYSFGKKKFDFAHCLVSSFKYVLEEDAARHHLKLMADCLKPGGVYALGLHISDYDYRKKTLERWTGSRDGIDVVCCIQGWPADRKTRTEQVRSRIVATEGGETRRYETTWTFRTYDLAELKSLIASETRLEHIATFDFNYDFRMPNAFTGDQLDNLLILRRR